MCVCAHLGYRVVYAFTSFIASATFIYCAIYLIADINNLMQYCKLYYINLNLKAHYFDYWSEKQGKTLTWSHRDMASYLNLERGRNVLSRVRNVL